MEVKMGLFGRKEQEEKLMCLVLNGIRVTINPKNDVVIYQDENNSVLKTEVRRDIKKIVSELLTTTKTMAEGLVGPAVVETVEDEEDEAKTEEKSEEE